eukprot:scaffold1368_cov333-Pavlova_lutheri.AAC.31
MANGCPRCQDGKVPAEIGYPRERAFEMVKLSVLPKTAWYASPFGICSFVQPHGQRVDALCCCFHVCFDLGSPGSPHVGRLETVHARRMKVKFAGVVGWRSNQAGGRCA